MSDRIAHRGPDAAGIWNHEDDRVSVQLGHRRLSIIDLSAAADQPLSKHGLTLVYNGELYNYKELRTELAGRGVSFATKSDTEVVLEAWRCWGPEALRKFRGMFAFALADTATGELVLARDPLGIKPLLYRQRGEGVVFASELKALLAAIGLRAAHRARRARGVHALLLGPRAALRHPGRAEASRWVMGSFPPGRHARGALLLARAGRRARGRGGPGRRSAIRDRGVGDRAPGGRRPGVELPVRRPGLEHRHGPGAPGRERGGCLHDHLPARGPEAGGDAGRRRLRAEGGGAVRHQPARDRDLTGHRGPATAHGRHPRRADR